MRRAFRGQEKEVLGKLREVAAVAETKQTSPIDETQIESLLFEAEEWESTLSVVGRRIAEASVKEAGKAALTDIGAVGLSFDLEHPTAREFIRQRFGDKDSYGSWPKGLNDVTAKQLRRELELGIQGGEGTGDLMGRVRKVFRHADETRAERIARTESGMAYNNGTATAYDQAGVKKIRWITTINMDTRDPHRAMHGRETEWRVPFIVDGEEMLYPHDPSASAANTINCRCTYRAVSTLGEESSSAA